MSFFGEKCSKLLVVIIIVLVIDVLDIDNNYLKNIYLWSYVLLQLCNLGIIIMLFSCPQNIIVFEIYQMFLRNIFIAYKYIQHNEFKNSNLLRIPTVDNVL